MLEDNNVKRNINIAILEDDKIAAEDLKSYFKKYTTLSGKNFKLIHYLKGEDFLAEYKQAKFSIILMDIDLPGISGLETAQRLRQIDNEVVLLFVTKMAQYAQKGYEVGALDFLIKPVKYAEFGLKIKKAINIARSRETQAVMVPANSGYIRISTEKIMYIESVGHYVKYVLTDGELEARGPLYAVEQILADKGFLRCSSCYIVNVKFIDLIDGYDITVAGHKLKISHPRRKEFIKALMNIYLGSSGGVRG